MLAATPTPPPGCLAPAIAYAGYVLGAYAIVYTGIFF
jgi:hypothetical protein